VLLVAEALLVAEVLLVAEALLVAEMAAAGPYLAKAWGDVCHDGCSGLSPLDLPRLPPGAVAAGRPRNTGRPVTDPGTGLEQARSGT
jgi:hypothetical protein